MPEFTYKQLAGAIEKAVEQIRANMFKQQKSKTELQLRVIELAAKHIREQGSEYE